jgi:hypothetical protein
MGMWVYASVNLLTSLLPHTQRLPDGVDRPHLERVHQRELDEGVQVYDHAPSPGPFGNEDYPGINSPGPAVPASERVRHWQGSLR